MMKQKKITRVVAWNLLLGLICGLLPLGRAMAGETTAAAQASAEDPGMLPVILGAVFAFVVGNLLIARSRKKQQKKDEE